MRFLTIIAALLISISSMGQTAISGRVLDSDGLPLPGANVYLDGTYDGASSDADGYYNFESAESGEYLLKIVFIGFEDFDTVLTLTGDAIALNVRMEAGATQLEPVTITAGSFGASDAQKAVVLKPLDIVTTAGADGNIVSALQTLPGTTTVGESGRLFVRGGDGRESQVYIDGLRVHEAYTSGPPQTAVRGRFNPFLFSGTTFSSGGFSAEYGDALSGVLLLETKALPVEDELNVGLMSLGGDLAYTKAGKQSGLTVQASYINLATFVNVVPTRFDWHKPYESGQGSVAYQRHTPKGSWKAFVQGARSSMAVSQPQPGDDFRRVDLENDYMFGKLSWAGQSGKHWRHFAGVSASVQADDFQLETQGLEQTRQGMQAKWTSTFYGWEGVRWKSGVLADVVEAKDVYSEGSNGFQEGVSDVRPATFTEIEHTLTNAFAYRVGLRASYSDFLGTYRVAPRFSAALRAGDNAQFSLAGGRFHQQPGMNVLQNTTAILPEVADHLILNYQYDHNRRYFRIEGYAKQYRKLVTWENAGTAGPNYANDGSGYARGIELFYRDQKTVTMGDFWVSYSLTDARRRYQHYPESVRPPFAVTHQVSGVYKHWIGAWRSLVSGTLTVASARSYDDPNTEGFMAAKVPGFKTLNLSWSYLYREHIIFHASVNNVPGWRNVFGYNFADQPGANGQYASVPVRPDSDRFFFVGCFITLSKGMMKNQLDQLN